MSGHISQEKLSHARAALQSAQADMVAIRQAQSLAALRLAWISFLQNHNRSFNKAHAELKRAKKFQG
jgi:multidrug resistance efflux pump